MDLRGDEYVAKGRQEMEYTDLRPKADDDQGDHHDGDDKQECGIDRQHDLHPSHEIGEHIEKNKCQDVIDDGHPYGNPDE